MNYYIGDLHLYCKNQLGVSGKKYDGRPFADIEEMHKVMVEKWNARVTEDDTVYILGDVGMKLRKHSLYDVISQMNGHKILIQGNHDDLTDTRYPELFDEIHDYLEIQDVADGKKYELILCHYPILMWNNQHKGSILIYGHTHNTIENDFFKDCIRRMNEDINLRHEKEEAFIAINVGCMFPYMEYEPKCLKELLDVEY